MSFKCRKCGFIHDGEMIDGYICPLCGSGIYDFKLIKNDSSKKIYNRVNISKDNKSIQRINEKCINCGVCSKTCEKVGIKYDSSKCDGICINCGQCILTCPTGALTPKYDYNTVMSFINDEDYKVCILTSPAVRTQLGDAFGFKPGEFVEGKMIAALKQIGFDYVFDTTFGADITSMEEACELNERINEGKLPMYSSCCPSWVKYLEIYHPDMIKNLTTVKSPIGCMSTVISKCFAPSENIDVEKLIIVALTPCTSKKEEIKSSDCDYVITTSELALLIRENNIDFKNLKDEKYDTIYGSSSGKIFGFSGGVTLSVLRSLYYLNTKKDLKNDMIYIKNHSYYKEMKIKVNDRFIKCVIVSTMPNLEKLLVEEITYDFCEVMNCEGGCINGGGQIIMPVNIKKDLLEAREKSLSIKDNNPAVKYPYKNDYVIDLYEDFLDEPNSAKAKELLHRKYQNQSSLLEKKS